VFEHPLSLIQAERAGNVKLGSIVQVSWTLHPHYTFLSNEVTVVYPPDIKWHMGGVSPRGAVATCRVPFTDFRVHRMENLSVGDKITVRGELSSIQEPAFVPKGGVTREAILDNCTIIR
jgi:hypothetical protein